MTRAARGRSPEGDAARAVEAAVRSAEQGLEDLARTAAAEVLFVRHARDASPEGYLEALSERALAAGFAVASARVVSGCAFDSLESVVEAAVNALRVTGLGRKSGLVALLDDFAAKRAPKPERASDALVERLTPSDLAGDLGQLAVAYLSAKAATKAERARIDAWLSGVSVARATGDDSAIQALSARTAKRALGDVTRIVRALGHRGTLLILHGAEDITLLPPARRQAAYTVLRELIDNADGGRGMIAAALVIIGSSSLFNGPRSIASLEPLAQRVGDVSRPSLPPRPHQPLIDLDVGPPSRSRPHELRSPRDAACAPLRSILRASHGLPPIEHVTTTSVGHEEIERAIDTLFEHSRAEGSVFALLTGGYGAGKTHFMLHLAARALADKRPVFRLSLECLDLDLGHPERHLRRLLDGATLPGLAPMAPGASSTTDTPLDLLARWTDDEARLPELLATLAKIAKADGEAADAARRAVAIARRSRAPGRALASHLGASDLVTRAVSPSARKDAYGRLLLWLELLALQTGSGGPVLLIDEAENLYRSGVTPAERRTALRSLSFYCGGALPRACVVLAVTPEALAKLQAEAPLLLEDVAKQRGVLAWEDATMLNRRLARARPLEVPPFGRGQCTELAARLLALHREARGAPKDPDWEAKVAAIAGAKPTPRQATRMLVDHLERDAFWGLR